MELVENDSKTSCSMSFEQLFNVFIGSIPTRDSPEHCKNYFKRKHKLLRSFVLIKIKFSLVDVVHYLLILIANMPKLS